MQLKSLYCDILHCPEKEFWRATLREIFERYLTYAELKGYRKGAEQVIAKQHKDRSRKRGERP